MSTGLFTVPQADNASALTAVDGGDDHHHTHDAPAFPNEQIHDLARSLSRHSEAGKHLPWEADADSILNPASPNFNAREWVKAILSLQAENPDAPGRTTGIAFTDLQAYGTGGGLEYQQTVSNLPIKVTESIKEQVTSGGNRVQILQPMDGLVRSGEMLVVLGPPGSGCSTLLKTFAGETDGFTVEGDMNYKGISQKEMATDLRGEAIYSAEVDVHFPQLTVGDTLYFAAKARSPRHPPAGLKTNAWATHMRDVIMAIFGISHTINTMVGNDFIRGVSGGERKRVSIAEAVLSGAPLQLWDNSTRGLDAANAVEFCKTLRLASDLAGTVACVAIYQAPGAAYDCFDKVSVLYKGRQIYFGKTTDAKQYFLDLGFHCPSRQTTADFLTSLTSDLERTVQDGWKGPTPPATPDEFEHAWKASNAYAALQKEIAQYNQEFAIGGPSRDAFIASRRAQQTKGARGKSPFILSFGKQLELCVWRGFRRLVGNPEITVTQLIGNFLMALIISSVFYNLPMTTSSFQRRGVLLFFAILLAAFASMLEILTLYAQRPIVEKHARYAFYHPSAEAFASMLCDMPYKIMNSILFSLTLYFMTNLRREPGPYFFFLLITFTLTMVMSMVFRTIAASSRTLTQALCPAALLILGLVIFTGYVIPTPDMLGWCRWINYIDPISYGFEALMVNEFHGQNYDCDVFVPSGAGYETVSGLQQVCSAVGSTAGSSIVNGDAYINTAYQYYHGNKWRNFGILIAFTVFFMGTYLAASEFISGQKSKGEVLLFQRAELKRLEKKKRNPDVEAGLGEKATRAVTGHQDVSMIPKQTAIFQWEDMVYDIKIKGETRRILDHVDGWVKPGTLTALMGVSGAGKTTLLDVLAQRVTMGVVTGKALVDGRQRDDSFQRKTGYVQQQDLHLSTTTVREALTFSALLRQPAHVSKEEKLEYVEEVIDLLEMRPYADAVIGVPGEGLNVEQRKRTTIGVELAAKPQLLLFLDEPTSGLDSQTSWAICDLLTKLAEHGQAILCTIHQPSAMLFSRFDRLLFLAKGGKTIYFGPVGQNSHVLIDYFQRNGAFACPEEANPAEWMLEVIGAAPGSHSDIDWHQTWRASDEFRSVKDELHDLEHRGQAVTGEKDRSGSGSDSSSTEAGSAKAGEKAATAEFAASLGTQFFYVTKRVFEQYWRTPSYIYSKMALTALSGLFVGFVFFKANLSQQGLQNQLFSIFMILTIFGNLVQQIMPLFGTQRALYEVRERPSKTYSWIIFMLSNIVVEIPFNSIAATLIFLCYYYPVGLYNNAIPTNAVHIRGFLFWLFTQQFLLFTSTFTHMVVAGMESIETAGNIAQLLFSLCLIFCGVLAPPGSFPQFWIFMYRLSPFTYLVEGFLTVGLADASVTCSAIEYLTMDPPAGQTCGAYLGQYLATTGGYLLDEAATTGCQLCSYSSTNTFLSLVQLDYGRRWRDYGILWAFIIFNVAAALGIYWLARVPKKSSAKEAATPAEAGEGEGVSEKK